MKRKTLLLMILAASSVYCTSCARGISPYDAANGKASCGKHIR